MLAKQYRLKKQKDFDAVSKEQSFFEDFLVLKKARNSMDISRFGFVVSSKVSKKAVKRNKVKRRLRSIVKDNIHSIITGYDIVIFTKKGIEEKEFKEIEQALINLLKKSNVYN